MRWRLVEEEDGAGQGTLFAEEEIVERHVGTGEYRGLEFLHVRARSIINEVPGAQRLPFRWTINPYRGCSHACVYCLSPDTPILRADGSHSPIAELSVGDQIYGTVRCGSYRELVATSVLAKWQTVERAHRVTLADGTSLVASGDHRFLTNRGWKHVTGAGARAGQRPHLTLTNHLLGTGAFVEQPKHDDDYRRGYLAGMILGDGHIGHHTYTRASGREMRINAFRLARADVAGLVRTREFLRPFDLTIREFDFGRADATHRPMRALGTARGADVALIEQLAQLELEPSESWSKGFLAGIFDAEGSYSRGILRISNCDDAIISAITSSLDRFGFDWCLEVQPGTNLPVRVVRVRGGQTEHLRFFHLVDPAIRRKTSLLGQRIKNKAQLRVVSVEDLGIDIPMYDITTGTGDFIANGVVSHNCFARPTHDYLGMNIGSDFDSKIVVKVNAVEKLRSELAGRRWAGDHIAMGTNTDPYQRCEGKYHLTQGIVRVLSEFANPFSILTKSTLILRDLPLLVEAAARTDVAINFSIGTLDERTWKLTEPGTPHPRRRVEAVRKITDAGVACGVLVAPIIPGFSDAPEQLDEVVRECLAAGAVSITAIPLHLRRGVKEHWMSWLADADPSLVAPYARRYRRGAYLPKAEQATITATVRRVLSEVRGAVPAASTEGPAGGAQSRAHGRDRVTSGEGPFQERLL